MRELSNTNANIYYRVKMHVFFIANDHISHIRSKFPKLSTTCMGRKHYVEDFNHD